MILLPCLQILRETVHIDIVEENEVPNPHIIVQRHFTDFLNVTNKTPIVNCILIFSI